jgi:hypothetical protein
MSDDDMSDLGVKYLRRLMVRDAVVWANRHGQKLLGGYEAMEVLREWRAEQRGGLTAVSLL